jgi:CheY-like chemotaxis protein
MRNFLAFLLILAATLVFAQESFTPDQLADLVEKAEPDQRGELILEHVKLLLKQERMEEVAYYLRRLDRAVEVQPSLRGFVKEAKGLLAINEGNTDLSQPILADAEAAYKQIGDRFGMARCQQTLAEGLILEGKTDEALEKLAQTKLQFAALEEKDYVAQNEILEGQAFKAKQQPGKAIFHFSQGIDYFISQREDDKAVMLSLVCSALADSLGNFEESLDHAKRALDISQASKNADLVAASYQAMTNSFLRVDDYNTALETALNGISFTHQSGNLPLMASLQIRAAEAQYSLGHRTEGDKLVEESLAAVQQSLNASSSLSTLAATTGLLRQFQRPSLLMQSYQMQAAWIENIQPKIAAQQNAKLKRQNDMALAFQQDLKPETENVQTANQVQLFIALFLAALLGGFFFVWKRSQRLQDLLKRNNEEIVYENKALKNSLNQSDSKFKSQQTQLDKAKSEQETLQSRLVLQEERLSGFIRDLETSRHKLKDSETESLSLREQLLLRVAETGSAFQAEQLAEGADEIQLSVNMIARLSKQMLDNNPNKTKEDIYREIRFATEDLMTVLNDMLEKAHVNTSKVMLDAQPFDPLRSLNWLKTTIGERTIESGFQIEFDFDDLISPILMGDGDALTRTVALMIDYQARQYPKAHHKVSATNILNDGNTEVHVFIETAHTTLDDHRIKNLTHSINATDENVRRALRLAEMQHGEWNLSNNEGGHLWQLRLPFHIAIEQSAKQDHSKLIGTRVLIVDDEAINRNLTAALLTKNGLIVQTAINGQEALEKIFAEDFDLVLMDLMMPVLDGYQATRALRESDLLLHREMPIIALTASAYIDETEKAQMFGMTEYLGKPFSPVELLDKMSMVWDRHLVKHGVMVKLVPED